MPAGVEHGACVGDGAGVAEHEQLNAQLVRDTGDRFAVHRRVYTDPDIFEHEIDRIFHRQWVYVGHESEIEAPGDYKTTVVGRQPVILSRDSQGEVRVLLNRCSHRGAVVCREDRGHANVFRCFYHNWVYKNSGELLGTAQPSGYPDDFNDGTLDLKSAANTAIYRGLIFANLAGEVSSFEERIEPIRPYLDAWLDRSPSGAIRVSPLPEPYGYPANWKFQAENGVDGYHGNYVHESYAKLLEHAGERSLRDITAERGRLGAVNIARGFKTGDGMLERDSAMLGSFDSTKAPEYERLVREIHGPEYAEDILRMRNIFIFPNLYLFESHLRVLKPRAVDHTVADNYFVYLQGVDDDLNDRRLREHERFFGTAGMGSADDVEVFVYNQTGLQAEGVDWVDLSRGLKREEISARGEWVGHTSDEQPQRALYRRWGQLMNDAEVAVP